jgi:hypothetical protein
MWEIFVTFMCKFRNISAFLYFLSYILTINSMCYAIGLLLAFIRNN